MANATGEAAAPPEMMPLPSVESLAATVDPQPSMSPSPSPPPPPTATTPMTSTIVSLLSTSPMDDQQSTWERLIWVPYAVLCLILIMLACASFIHFHMQNREKYRGKHKKSTVHIQSLRKKYRVTLHSKGVTCKVPPYALSEMREDRASPQTVCEHAHVSEKGASKTNKYKQKRGKTDALITGGGVAVHNTRADIFVTDTSSQSQGEGHSGRKSLPNPLFIEQNGGPKCNGGVNFSYKNEAYRGDREGSDRMLVEMPTSATPSPLANPPPHTLTTVVTLSPTPSTVVTPITLVQPRPQSARHQTASTALEASASSPQRSVAKTKMNKDYKHSPRRKLPTIRHSSTSSDSASLDTPDTSSSTRIQSPDRALSPRVASSSKPGVVPPLPSNAKRVKTPATVPAKTGS